MSTLLIMAGGTGGHVFPALTVAENLRHRGVDVVWLGTKYGLEADAVPAAGFDMEWITIYGLRGKGWWGVIRTPFFVLVAVIQTVGVVLRRRPTALLGMGGFVAGPGGLVAWLLRRPLMIHEANAVAGFTNRVLARFACRVLTGFPDTFVPRISAEHVGNPVRDDIARLPEPEARLAGRGRRLRLLVIGGSQGAQIFNELMPDSVAGITPEPDVWHQSGRGRAGPVSSAYRHAGLSVRVDEFIDSMGEAYRWADVVVCRAGAMTVAEVSAAGVATIFVPFPHAVSDHQTANARHLVNHGAAMLISQRDLTAHRLRGVIAKLARDRGLVLELARRARELARPDAAVRVADICMEVMCA